MRDENQQKSQMLLQDIGCDIVVSDFDTSCSERYILSSSRRESYGKSNFPCLAKVLIFYALSLSLVNIGVKLNERFMRSIC